MIRDEAIGSEAKEGDSAVKLGEGIGTVWTASNDDERTHITRGILLVEGFLHAFVTDEDERAGREIK
jgi:hypothetical protein